MFKWNRIIVALIGGPLLIFVYTNISFAGIPLLIFTNLVVGIGTYEFYKMLKFSGKSVYDKFGILVALLIPNIKYLSLINSYMNEYDSYTVEIIAIALIVLLSYRIFKNQIAGSVESISLTFLGIVYVSVFFSQIIDLYFKLFPIIPTGMFAFTPIMLLQILVWVSDTSAGIVGVSVGRKFFKNGFTEISPKKSVEGAIASLIFTGLAFVITVSFITGTVGIFSLKNLILFILGAFISFIAQIGDLVESLFKRECGVKDSGTILMGHGGVLDRFDSMIFVVPFITFVIKFIEKFFIY